ncbi:MAG: DNA glycosylase [Peptococcaceae bacterium BICA1-8]|nr:MAG: DNA glycosylase [Peptococcaceae bacterium BICA1-8]
MAMIKSFPPEIDKNSRILILGSIPGKESLRKREYYAHPRNQFWKIIYTLFEVPMDEDYNKKIKFLKGKGFALWDVIDVCYREGSLDSNIKEEKVNDFKSFFTEYPNIKYVFFNGIKAYETFRKEVGFGFPEIVFKRLLSTSPANAIKFEEKLREWMEIKVCP